MAKRYMFGAGGTSGHINPALAIADYVREREPAARILFTGMANGLEEQMTERAGYRMEPIRALGIAETKRTRLFSFLRENTIGVMQSRRLIREYRPDVVIGTGGFACSPLVLAALFHRVPVLLHEQNAFPGRSNRLFAPFARTVCISFAESGKYFRRRSHLLLSGNPLRKEYLNLDRTKARAQLGLSEEVFLVLVMGGSLGAASLNRAVIGLGQEALWQELIDRQDIKLKLSTGFDQVEDHVQPANDVPSVSAENYIHDGALWMAAADLFVGRAGAMTCSELSVLATPSILVPYPYAINDHQTVNARTLTDVGAAILLPDSELTSARLAQEIRDFVDQPEKLQEMSAAARRRSLPDALDIIYGELTRLTRHES